MIGRPCGQRATGCSRTHTARFHCPGHVAPATLAFSLPERLVIGVDPGSVNLGFGVVAQRGTKLVRIASGTVRCGKRPLPERLAMIFDQLRAVCLEHCPTEAAIEGVFHQRYAQAALVLGHARGVALVALQQSQLPIAEYAPTEVKKAITGTGRAEKGQVQRMVSMMLDRYEPETLDESDALAIAICHINRPLHTPRKFR